MIGSPASLRGLLLLALVALRCSEEVEEPVSAAGETGSSTTSQPPESTVMAETQAIQPSADQLWAELLQADPRKNWKLFPGYEWPKSNESGGAHAGKLEWVYVNPESESALQSGKTGAAPDSSTVVKYLHANSDPANPGDLKIVAAMRKGRGFNPDAGDWYWAEWDGNGKLIAEQSKGASGICTSCHSSAKRDYIRLTR